MSTRFRLILPTVAILAILSTVNVRAYGDSLSGRVLDPSGSIVPNVSLRLFDRSTGQIRQASSQNDGSYRFEGISGGTRAKSSRSPP